MSAEQNSRILISQLGKPPPGPSEEVITKANWERVLFFSQILVGCCQLRLDHEAVARDALETICQEGPLCPSNEYRVVRDTARNHLNERLKRKRNVVEEACKSERIKKVAGRSHSARQHRDPAVSPEDIAQQTYVNLLESKKDEDALKDPRYQVGTTKHTAAKMHRHGGRQDPLPHKDLVEDRREKDPSQVAQERERDDHVNEKLSLLPEDQRHAVILKDLLDHTFEEGANLTGVPLGTFVTRVRLGRQKLHDLLKEDGSS